MFAPFRSNFPGLGTNFHDLVYPRLSFDRFISFATNFVRHTIFPISYFLGPVHSEINGKDETFQISLRDLLHKFKFGSARGLYSLLYVISIKL